MDTPDISLLSLVISIVAAVAAIASARFAWNSAQHAKRQADATVGDLPPHFGMYRAPKMHIDEREIVIVDVVNWNRRRLLIESMTISSEPEYIVITKDETTATTVAKVRAQYEGRDFERVFDPAFVVNGMTPGAPFGRWESELHVSKREYVRGEAITATIEVTVKYRLEGDELAQKWSSSLTLISNPLYPSRHPPKSHPSPADT